MGLTNEAGYLYVYSKKLIYINKKIRSASKGAEKHLKKHQNADNHEKKEKHYNNHLSKKSEIEKWIKEHNKILKTLHNHEVAFAHALRKEHNISKH